MKLLIVEDEPLLLNDMESYLAEQGYLCETAIDFVEGEDKILLYEYDAIILDVGLPGGSGLKLLELLKKQQKDTGVLIVSAKDSLQDRVTGLEMGADDYITKPFYMEELNARINALLRRKNFSGHKIIAIDELYVDTVAAEVKWQDTVISLTKKEYELLLYLIINKNRVVSKQSIARHLWGDDYDTVDNYHTVYVHTRNLRNKITALSGCDFVKTVYGMGYKFTER